ncbi:MAG: RecQ family ATP-dependent DNA helicase [Bacteroidales bacterium]|nr:RecQ family ATP-dependent DNA helicase [Bacteroidales bacterium]
MTPKEVLKRYWGYDSFRPLQEEIINSVLNGKDTLGLMPTGGGKSITFQVPALIKEGTTIVVTPLISLMKDQVDNLKRKRIKAVFLHSGMTARERRLANEMIFNARAKFIYVSPERLRNPRFIQQLRMLQIAMIVVDEAHCISQWGYDFRPSYLHINELRKVAPSAPILAVTATATTEVADDICKQLLMKDPNIFRMSFARSNLNYIVRQSETKITEVFHILSRTSGSAIVYVRSRKRTRDIAEYLKSLGVSAAHYHAGLDYEVKADLQNRWQSGEIRVMVATNAFGMGIDKPDVRVVIHYDMPPSLEEYYQEAGRAGRDGLNSFVVLLSAKSDPATLRRRVTESFPKRDRIKEIYGMACDFVNVAVGEGYESLFPFDFEKFCRVFNLQKKQAMASLHLLAQSGYLEYLEETDRRSRAMITVPREELYQIEGLSPSAERLLHTLLRQYTGLFIEYVNISETILSAETGFSEREIYDTFLELSRAKVVSYIPKSGIPYIYFPTAREEIRYLRIPVEVYEERMKVISDRVESMIAFIDPSLRCRENHLLKYFGEERKDNCGRCDRCRSLKAEKKTRKEKNRREEELLQALLDYIKVRPNGVDFLIISHSFHSDRKLIADLLHFLVTEGYVEEKGNAYYPLNSE